MMNLAFLPDKAVGVVLGHQGFGARITRECRSFTRALSCSPDPIEAGTPFESDSQAPSTMALTQSCSACWVLMSL